MRILVASLPVSWAPPLSCVAFILLCAGCAGGLPPVAVAAQRHNDAGTELLAGNHLDDAEARFRLALEYHPHFAEAHLNLGLLLLARGRIKAAIRGWFEDQGFIEVETSCLQVSPGNEAHLHGFRTEAIGNDGMPREMYLHTSPEFAMKKLLAAGERHIHAFSHVWRNRERGALHSPEFTMLEWYRADEDYDALMDDCAALLAEDGTVLWANRRLAEILRLPLESLLGATLRACEKIPTPI